MKTKENGPEDQKEPDDFIWDEDDIIDDYDELDDEEWDDDFDDDFEEDE